MLHLADLAHGKLSRPHNWLAQAYQGLLRGEQVGFEEGYSRGEHPYCAF